MTKKYRMKHDSRVEPSVLKGDIVYRCEKHDYGSASTDTRISGEPYISMTKDPSGDYPFFTVPARDLEEIE